MTYGRMGMIPVKQGFMGQAYREGGNEDEKWEENNEIATLSSKVRNDIKAV